MDTNERIDRILGAIWGYSSLRPGQRAAITAQINGKDALLIAPTGGGKTLTFQMPALMRPGVTIVITPLIALMKDQVDGARKRGIYAFALNHNTSKEEYLSISTMLHTRTCKLLYISPEKLLTPTFKTFLKSIVVSAIVVDEAHCIAQDGPEFRPEYLQISEAIKELHVPVFACTATATRETETVIIDALRMKTPVIIRGTFNRPNLYYEVRPKEIDDITQVQALAGLMEGSGIIYRTTRAQTDETALKLRRLKLNAMPYHAGMLPMDRNRIQEAFLADKIQIVVATIAFGMGIDKPDIRWVIHGDIPKNIEGYYQETGRAGRDGDPASCYLLYSKRDIPITRGFIERSLNVENRNASYTRFLAMLLYAKTDKCRRQQLLNYFGETAPDRCGNCDICGGER
jgi:ATP-dependent DNA helicase RecQ